MKRDMDGDLISMLKPHDGRRSTWRGVTWRVGRDARNVYNFGQLASLKMSVVVIQRVLERSDQLRNVDILVIW